MKRSLAILIAIVATSTTLVAQLTRSVVLGHRVVAEFPHSTECYTQGLEIVDGVMYESAGEYGKSRIMRVERESGKERERIATLPESEFAEGLTIVGDTIFALTWRENKLYMFDRVSNQLIATKHYAGEGWGLCNDGTKLYMSDGSDRIFVRDPKTFEIIEQHNITINGRPLRYINEMEWIEGQIWANVYGSNYIVIIDPTMWAVVGMVDLEGILPQNERTPATDVLNGIAYDKATRKIYVTGKNWSKLYEIEIANSR